MAWILFQAIFIYRAIHLDSEKEIEMSNAVVEYKRFLEPSEFKSMQLEELKLTLLNKYNSDSPKIVYTILDEGDRQSFEVYCYNIRLDYFEFFPAYSFSVLEFMLVYDKDKFNYGVMKGFNWYLAYKSHYFPGDTPGECIDKLLAAIIKSLKKQIKHINKIRKGK
jgi:hypothetical protein